MGLMGALQYRRIDRSDPEYPPLLTEVPKPPKALFVAGRPLEHGPSVAIVGTRKPTPYGLRVAERFACELARAGMTIVSGMARGVDAAAHRGCLQAGGTTVAVLGSGLDVCYPRTNRKLYEDIIGNGTLVSEYEIGTAPLPAHFPMRNRIIAGICLGVLIVEGKPDGGAMITARLALECSREVFAVPGSIHSPVSQGPHQLLRDGARIATTAADILEELGLEGQLSLRLGVPAPQLDLSPEESRLLDQLSSEARLLDLLAGAVLMPASTVSAILQRLELKGLVSRHPGGRFSLSSSL